MGTGGEYVRRLARATLPRPFRRFLRIAAGEIPQRLRDFPADLRDAVVGTATPLPPARLRYRVSGTSSRQEFDKVGKTGASVLVDAFRRCREAGSVYPRWLDYGSGAGRIARHLVGLDGIAELVGVDVDPDLVAWSDRRLAPARFQRIAPLPPTDFPAGRFDVTVCVSVFTHFDQETGHRWAAELARLLRPGGILIVSTHGAAIAAAQPLNDIQRRHFAETGFVFIPEGGSFNDDAAFYSEAYLRSAWGRWFEPNEFVHQGLMGFQDLSTWRCL